MTEQTLKPHDGRRVRHPDGRLLAEEGEAVTLTPYWNRRIEDGDVQPIERPARTPRKPRSDSPTPPASSRSTDGDTA